MLFCVIVGVKAFLPPAKDDRSAVAPTLVAASSKRHQPKRRRRKDEMDSLLTGKQDDLLYTLKKVNLNAKITFLTTTDIGLTPANGKKRGGAPPPSTEVRSKNTGSKLLNQ